MDHDVFPPAEPLPLHPTPSPSPCRSALPSWPCRLGGARAPCAPDVGRQQVGSHLRIDTHFVCCCCLAACLCHCHRLWFALPHVPLPPVPVLVSFDGANGIPVHSAPPLTSCCGVLNPFKITLWKGARELSPAPRTPPGHFARPKSDFKGGWRLHFRERHRHVRVETTFAARHQRSR